VTGARLGAGAVCTLASALVVGLGSVQAADGDALTRQQLEQKIRLTESLISDSPAAQRIGTSGHAEAMGHLEEGRVHHALALDLLAKGDQAGARKAVDEALKHLGWARRLVPDVTAQQNLARQRHQQLRGSVERLLESWRVRTGGQPGDDGTDMTEALGLLSTATQHAQSGRYDEANQALMRAERHVLNGMNRSLHSVTLDYTVRPTSVAQAFEFENARYASFAELLPLAIRDLKPTPDANALIDRYNETSNALQAQALQLFQSGQPDEALKLIRSATLYIQRALLAAGLVSPQPSGSTP
jgi:tetratricopeptide (TPR) repeat protein